MISRCMHAGCSTIDHITPGFATNQINNIVRELQVHIATLTLDSHDQSLLATHRAKDYRSRRHPRSLNTGTLAHKVMDQQLEQHCSQPWDSHDQSLAQRALNYQPIDITMHTHPLNIE